jgi:hypothetical protein
VLGRQPEASSWSRESSAHSVVPLKAITGPVGKVRTSTVMSDSTNTWSSMSRSATTKRSPATGDQCRPASRRALASGTEIMPDRNSGGRAPGTSLGRVSDVRVGISGGTTRRGAGCSTRRGCRTGSSSSTRPAC